LLFENKNCIRLKLAKDCVTLGTALHRVYDRTLSLSACKFRHVNSNLPWGECNWLLKGMGDETLAGLFIVTPKTHQLLIKRIETTLLDHARQPFFPSVN